MRILLSLVVVLALIWGGLWFATARGVERGAETWFAEQAAAGLVADYAGLDVRGFPGRLELRLEAPRLIDPFAGTGWEAPDLAFRIDAQRPGTLLAQLPSEQRLRLPDDTLTLRAADLSARLSLSGLDLLLGETELAGHTLVLEAESGWAGTLDRLRLASRALPDAPERQEISLDVERLALDPGWHATLPPEAGLPAEIEVLRGTLTLGFAAPLDRHMGDRPARLTALGLDRLEGIWGEVRLGGDGSIAIGPDGIPEGRLTLRATNWRALVPAAVAAGMLRAEVAPTWERVLETLEEAGGTPGLLEVPLIFQRGFMSLGPLPLGPAPRLPQL